MLRRKWIRQALSFAILIPLLGRLSYSQEGNSINSAELNRSNRNAVPLIDQLTNGLRVTRAVDVQFLQIVVQKVDDGQLPQAMVNLVYRWAIQRNPRVPFPYFQLAMRELSRRRGVKLP